MLWLLFEASLAALKQTVGLAKTHLRQEGRQLAAAQGLSPSSSPFRLQPTDSLGQAQQALILGALSIFCELLGPLMESNKYPRVLEIEVWGSRSGAHLCVRHNSAHTLCLLLQSVLREVHEGHGTVLCSSINNLEGPERGFDRSSAITEG